ncbi:biopolymer transporter ExbD [Verrucomicrobiaceae bacterium N1E253]|uniref:Biopolymer transporter ExbD n=1 Tax=Oceaniferula marina TaxID=2748318 RepID=A0A851GHP1_9BACT|nr:biopolymer transporter ExbD [Oceaniferula marina]NWK56392.1 biopolymer transporter ExbD [Oceaniferula marina]
MQIKRSKELDDDVDVSMSPLIDCVFLLLIFFLVTTMLKKTERRIPIRQPDAVLSVADTVKSDTMYIGLTKQGTIKRPLKQRDAFGRITYVDVPDLPAYLKILVAEGKKNRPLVIQVQKDVEFQDVLRVFDVCTIQGFSNVKTYSDSDNFQSIYRKEKDEN